MSRRLSDIPFKRECSLSGILFSRNNLCQGSKTIFERWLWLLLTLTIHLDPCFVFREMVLCLCLY